MYTLSINFAFLTDGPLTPDQIRAQRTSQTFMMLAMGLMIFFTFLEPFLHHYIHARMHSSDHDGESEL